jgi:ATP-dependent DNA helicase RecG
MAETVTGPLDALARVVAGETAYSLESRTLDFKRQGRSRDDALKNLAEAAACFANASGGTLIVGSVTGRAARRRSRAQIWTQTWHSGGSTN